MTLHLKALQCKVSCVMHPNATMHLVLCNRATDLHCKSTVCPRVFCVPCKMSACVCCIRRPSSRPQHPPGGPPPASPTGSPPSWRTKPSSSRQALLSTDRLYTPATVLLQITQKRDLITSNWMLALCREASTMCRKCVWCKPSECADRNLLSAQLARLAKVRPVNVQRPVT